MKIKRFEAQNVHGYLNFDVTFNDDLTFLTGINGGGKTTVIQSIVALISPTFYVLANLEYSKLSVIVEHQGSDLEISAFKKEGQFAHLRTSASDDFLEIRPFVQAPDEPSYRAQEREDEYYAAMNETLAGHSVVTAISDLPTPMFLDLDRRAQALQGRRTGARAVQPAWVRRGRNIFSFFLSNSIQIATYMVEQRYKDTLIAISKLSEELRQLMVLDLIEPESSVWDLGPFKKPTKAELDSIEHMRRSVQTLPSILNVPRSEVESRMIPSLDKLERSAKAIPKGSSIQEILSDNQSPTFTALVEWSANKGQLSKIVKIVKRVTEFNKKREIHTEQIEQYLSSVNAFLKDSGKLLHFDSEGSLSLKIDGVEGSRNTQSLSSGEAQLFIILAHLFFNRRAQNANVFIIDEPELSLHVQWQELFVSSILHANPTVQYVLATHSPSIILDNIEKCIDLSISKFERAIR